VVTEFGLTNTDTLELLLLKSLSMVLVASLTVAVFVIVNLRSRFHFRHDVEGCGFTCLNSADRPDTGRARVGAYRRGRRDEGHGRGQDIGRRDTG